MKPETENYQVSWFDLPERFGPDEVGAVLEEIRASAEADLIAAMRRDEVLAKLDPRQATRGAAATLGGVNGLEFESMIVMGKYRSFWRERLCIHGGRLYRATYFGSGDPRFSSSWARFHESFRFL